MLDSNFPGFFQDFLIFFYFPGLLQAWKFIFFHFPGFLRILEGIKFVNTTFLLSVFINAAFRMITRTTEPQFEHGNLLLRHEVHILTMFRSYDVTKQYGKTGPERLTFSPIETDLTPKTNQMFEGNFNSRAVICVKSLLTIIA